MKLLVIRSFDEKVRTLKLPEKISIRTDGTVCADIKPSLINVWYHIHETDGIREKNNFHISRREFFDLLLFVVVNNYRLCLLIPVLNFCRGTCDGLKKSMNNSFSSQEVLTSCEKLCGNGDRKYFARVNKYNETFVLLNCFASPIHVKECVCYKYQAY